MAYTTIDDGSAHHQTAIYTGNDTDGTQITNDGNSNLKPDLLWIRNRTDSGNPPAPGGIWDSTRGFAENKVITPFTNNAEGANSNGFAIATTDGFTVEDGTSGANPRVATNKNNKNYVAWQWAANGGTTTAFSESGDNPGGTHQANTTGGFSIVFYTGTGAIGTVQHGLGAKPGWMIIKRLESADNVTVYHSSLGATHRLKLNTDNTAQDTDSIFNDTEPTSSVFTLKTNNEVNGDAETYVAWCWAPIKGYSKFGKYTGDGNSAGPFVHTGFKPAYLMIRRTDATQHFYCIDNTRDSYQNPFQDLISPNLNDAENANTARGDFLSNGFKIRSTANAFNADGGNYVYMAFAEHPFVSSKGVPVTAK